MNATQCNADREAAKAKIAKLMALGTDPAANQFEAEAAMRQAAFLMRKHAIEQAELADATGAASAFDWYTTYIPADPFHGTTSAVGWLGNVAVGIAEFTDVKMSWKRMDEYGYCLCIQGDATDVHYAAYLAKHLRDNIRAQSKAFVGTRREREDFRRAMSGRLVERMRQLKREQREEMRGSESGSKALVFVGNKIAARDAEFGAFKTRRGSGRRIDPYAAGAGRAAGDRMGFGRPVAHCSPARALGNGGAA
jgi:hypothetical protein